MYVYNYRIYDKYRINVVSLVVLADNNKNFRPKRYEVSYWNFKHIFEFPTVKLLDYQKKGEMLEASNNIFAVIVSAHLRSLETKNNIDKRLLSKVSLIKKLYKKGYKKDDILNLYRFIDWVISLPEELDNKIYEEIKKYEEDKKMPYVTTAEKIGIKKGREQGIQKGIQKGLLEGIELALKVKFGLNGIRLYKKITDETEIKKLRAIKNAIEIAKNVEEIKEIL